MSKLTTSTFMWKTLRWQSSRSKYFVAVRVFSDTFDVLSLEEVCAYRGVGIPVEEISDSMDLESAESLLKLMEES